MKLKETIRRILKEEFSEERKQRLMDKIIKILTSSIFVRDKGSEIIFWFVSDQINEPIFRYNKRKKTLKVLKGKVKNFLDVYLPESFGDEFKKDVLTTVFNNLTFDTLTLNSIIYEQ